MVPNLKSKIDWLFSAPLNKTTMTKRQCEETIDTLGTEIIVCGRLRTIVFKKIIGNRYSVSTKPFK